MIQGAVVFCGIVLSCGTITVKLYRDRNKAGRGHYVWKD